MGRKKVITDSMTHEEKFKLCLKEADALYKGDFIPETDNMEKDTIANVMFKVLHEWDMADEGETSVPKAHIKRAENFFVRWRDHIEEEYSNEKEMYKQF